MGERLGYGLKAWFLSHQGVPAAGLEPALYHYNKILSLARLPISPRRLNPKMSL